MYLEGFEERENWTESNILFKHKRNNRNIIGECTVMQKVYTDDTRRAIGLAGGYFLNKNLQF